MVANKKRTRRTRGVPAQPPATGFIATRPHQRIEMVLVEKSALLFLVSLGKAMQKARNPESGRLTRDYALDSAVSLAQNALGIQEQVVRAEAVARIHDATEAINDDTADQVINAS